ncbi:uncharacterized protein LOC133183193 [Saccostrea echinata]|uniref:uncharacterized protein LOC133183193 n=1 Tax=Saccostrea echinata TaxID=191078 RepID=UPI002A826D4D|nr:uncharacterized protein LOC133183193 [Saccostrea echinata]
MQEKLLFFFIVLVVLGLCQSSINRRMSSGQFLERILNGRGRTGRNPSTETDTLNGDRPMMARGAGMFNALNDRQQGVLPNRITSRRGGMYNTNGRRQRPCKRRWWRRC